MSERNVPQESTACNKIGNAKFFKAEKMVRGINNCIGKTEEWSEKEKRRREKDKGKVNKSKEKMWRGNLILFCVLKQYRPILSTRKVTSISLCFMVFLYEVLSTTFNECQFMGILKLFSNLSLISLIDSCQTFRILNTAILPNSSPLIYM